MILLTNITDDMTEEKNLLNISVNCFNPSLKYLLYNYNEETLRKYNYNTCRQTAFIGSAFLTKYCLENNIPYEFQAFEANCKDVIYGHHLSYVHAYIYATNKITNKHLLIDLSRTEQPIIFFQVPDNHYPVVHGFYQHLEVLSVKEIDWNSSLEVEEFITKLPGHVFLNKIWNMYGSYKTMNEEIKETFVQMCYASFTEMFGKSIGEVPKDVPFLTKQVSLLEEKQ